MTEQRTLTIRACDQHGDIRQDLTQQAEAERPEVVGSAWRNIYNNGFDHVAPLPPAPGGPVVDEPLMTVAQHERIVGALRTKADQLREALEWRKENQAGQRELLRSVTAERDAALARCAELKAELAMANDAAAKGDAARHQCAGMEMEIKELRGAADHWEAESRALQKLRDAALAELEKQEPAATVAKVPGEDWNSLDFHLDLQGMLPGTKLYAAPPAKAQHSVPEEFIGRLSEFLAQRGATGKALLRELRDMLAAAPGKEVPQAWLDVQAERKRQVEAEGWTPEHDDEHDTGALASAAGCYAMFSLAYPAGDPSHCWPWDKSWWKPSPDGRRNMVKAGALILAEIERLDRVAASQGGPSDA
ncbi:TPA: hypothetical protein ACPWEZ_001530 [Pseudomonas aeruginosa]